MKRIIRMSVVALSLLAGLATPVYAQDPPKQDEKKTDKAAAVDVSGTWDMTVETQQGPRTVAVTFTVENEKLSGTIKGPQGDVTVAGTVSAGELKFSATVSTQSGAMDVTFTGTAEKEKLSGKVDFGATGSGTWSAVRPKGSGL